MNAGGSSLVRRPEADFCFAGNQGRAVAGFRIIDRLINSGIVVPIDANSIPARGREAR